MKVQLAPELIRKLKKQRAIIRKSFKQATMIFSIDPEDPRLNSHELHKEWAGFRSIDVTADYRVVFEVIEDEDEPVAYFVALGTHKELYKA